MCLAPASGSPQVEGVGREAITSIDRDYPGRLALYNPNEI